MNPSPMKLIITEVIRYSILYRTTIAPTRQIMPHINGNKYKKEFSIATLVVMIKIYNNDWLENQGKN
jgi:hypothetical protein